MEDRSIRREGEECVEVHRGCGSVGGETERCARMRMEGEELSKRLIMAKELCTLARVSQGWWGRAEGKHGRVSGALKDGREVAF